MNRTYVKVVMQEETVKEELNASIMSKIPDI